MNKWEQKLKRLAASAQPAPQQPQESEAPMSAAERSAAAQELGRRGGLARAKALSAKQRKEIARKAGKAGGRGRKR